MRASIWTILILGILAFGLLLLGMCMTLHTFQQTPAGGRARVAFEIKEQFRFDAVIVERRQEEQRQVLEVTYDTQEYMQADPEGMHLQMKAVAKLLFAKCDPQDQDEVDEAHILRREIHPSDPDWKVATNDFRFPNPKPRRIHKP